MDSIASPRSPASRKEVLVDSMAQLFLIASVVSIVALPQAAFQVGKRLRLDPVAAVICSAAIIALAALSSYGLYHNATHLGLPTPNPWAYALVLYAFALGLACYMGTLYEYERKSLVIKASATLLVMLCVGGTTVSLIL